MTTEIIPRSKVEALDADKAIRDALRSIEVRWTEFALMLSNFNKHEYYRPLGFERFDDYLETTVAESRASCRKKMRLVEQLGNIPLRVLQSIPITNCERLLKAAPSQRDGLVEQARTLTIAEFAKVVKESKGSALEGDEDSHPLTFVLTTGQREVVERAIAKVFEAGDTTRRADALEFICAEFLSG